MLGQVVDEDTTV